jgi:hypothetical protein
MSSSLSSSIAATRAVVERYDESLKQIAQLKRENKTLRETIRVNEEKTVHLLEHYKTEIDKQTRLATEFKDELRAREKLEMLKRLRNFRDQSTWFEEEELQCKENELIAVIYSWEDEVQMLKNKLEEQAEDHERKSIEREANLKHSFLQDIDTFRSKISSSVIDEIRGALADTISDNQRLGIEFRMLLQEMERMQASRDEKDQELTRTRRELELVKHTNLLLGKRNKRLEELCDGGEEEQANNRS